MNGRSGKSGDQSGGMDRHPRIVFKGAFVMPPRASKPFPPARYVFADRPGLRYILKPENAIKPDERER